MNAALGSSPFSGESAYDPSAILAESATRLATFDTLVELISKDTGLDTLVQNVLSIARIEDSVSAFTTDLSAQLVTDVYPRFEAGMRDINAVVSSAFVIGRANIEEAKGREVSKYSSGLRYKSFGDDALKLIMMRLEYDKAVTHALVDANRIKIVALKEQADQNLQIDEADVRWDLEVFQYGGNLMASIHGAMGIPQTAKAPKPSVLGGAFSGAATGVMAGSTFGGYGAVIGGVVGAIAGGVGAYLS